MTLSFEHLKITVSDHVADVRLDRPDKLNAMNGALCTSLIEAGAALAADRSVRAVVLSGEGRGFCAGLDMENFAAMAGGATGELTTDEEGGSADRTPGLMSTEGRITHRAQQAAWAWQEVPVPVIAAVHGVALGAGIQIALGCDVRIVAPDARLSVLEIKWGLIPDMTATATLVRLVGLDVAKLLVWTGQMVSGTEAVELGLATKTFDEPHKAALAAARTIAAQSPDAVRAAKRLFNSAHLRTPAEAFAAERTEVHRLLGSPNQLEAIRAGLAKDTPVFTDPS